MADDSKAIVPVWTLATAEARVPAVSMDDSMTPERLTELRSALAALADQPIATLELYPLPEHVDRNRGIPLDAASPLAQHLSQLITQSAQTSSVAATATGGGEGLFRMVVPAKFAGDFSRGLIRAMPSRAVSGAVRSPLVDAAGDIVGHASYAPVGGAAAGVASGAGAAGAAAAGGVTLAVAAPLVLMAVAVGVSAAAEQRRQAAIDHITELLEQLYEEKLDDERSELDGCRDAIDKATAILLDEGKLGVSLGLDSAVHAIGGALAAAERRAGKWESSLDQIDDTTAVDVDVLTEKFPGIDGTGGVFRGHLELAALAIALKRRVIVLQAVDHAQRDPGNLFENFSRALKADEERLDRLESNIANVLLRLSELQLARPRGWHSPVVTSGEADRLLRAAYRIHALGDGASINTRPVDVAIEIARSKDGSVVVLPASAA